MEQRPSTTALGVAFGQLLDAYDSKLATLFVPDHRELLESCVSAFRPRGPRGLRMLERGWYRRLLWSVERVTARGIFLHYLLRKRFIEDSVRAAIADGCTQLVVIGAGLDTLATRLASEQSSLICIEVDHPATQAVKEAGLSPRGKPPNLTLTPVDLRERAITSVLSTIPAYDARRLTVFVAEGLLMYLHEVDVSSLLRDVRCAAADGSRLVFTFMEGDGSGRPRFKGLSRWYAPLLDFWLKRLGEPMHWAIDRSALPQWVEALGWHVLDIGTHETFRALYLAPNGLEERPLLDGEYVAVAE